MTFTVYDAFLGVVQVDTFWTMDDIRLETCYVASTILFTLCRTFLKNAIYQSVVFINNKHQEIGCAYAIRQNKLCMKGLNDVYTLTSLGKSVFTVIEIISWVTCNDYRYQRLTNCITMVDKDSISS